MVYPTFEQQSKHFKETIKRINLFADKSKARNIEFEIPVWDENHGLQGFPNSLYVSLNYRDITIADIQIFMNDECDKCKSIDLYKIDTDEMHRRRGFGKLVVNEIIELAKDLGCEKIFGDVLEADKYSSAGFYVKCGFEVKNRIFRMDL